MAESQRWQLLLRCPHSGPSVGGEALDGDCGSRPTLQSCWRAQGPLSQTSAEHPRGRSRHLQRAKDCGSGLIERFRQGCRWSGATVHGWWGKILLLSGVEMDSLRIRLRGCGGAVSHVYADSQRPHDIHSNQDWRRFEADDNYKTHSASSFARLKVQVLGLPRDLERFAVGTMDDPLKRIQGTPLGAVLPSHRESHAGY